MFKWLKIFLLIAIIVSAVALIMKKNNQHTFLNFKTLSFPFSSDPMDYDFYVHHYAFTSVMARLVSMDKKGAISPLLASKWEHDQEFKIWDFTIRENLTYSNGDRITPHDIAKSLSRMAYLKHQSNSNSGVLEYLDGFRNMRAADDQINGISINGNVLKLSFVKPMPDLLAKISFGFYSLAHPSLYNSKTGKWIEKKHVVASGAYEVQAWSNDKFVLKLRPSIPYVNYKNSVQQINFENLAEVKKADDLNDTDIIVADKRSLMVDDTFQYVSSSIGLKIGYVHLYGWNKGTELKRLEVRRWLRNKFYKSLETKGLVPTHSFFPESLKEIKPIISDPESLKPEFDKINIITHTMDSSLKLAENKTKKSVPEIFDLAIDSLNGEGVEIIKQDISDESNLEEFDLVINGTGIEAVDYWDTVRFMFLSKQGIKLPDETGVIHKQLQSSNPDINIINQELWNQAIIWPIRHYTNGFWFKKDSRLNYDEMNLDNPSIDFQYLHWKD